MFIIINKYNENISWINNLNKNLYNKIYIYNKGSNIDVNLLDNNNITINNVNNIGRETEGYLRFIIENYENLIDDDFYVFLQGHPFDHCKN